MKNGNTLNTFQPISSYQYISSFIQFTRLTCLYYGLLSQHIGPSEVPFKYRNIPSTRSITLITITSWQRLHDTELECCLLLLGVACKRCLQYATLLFASQLKRLKMSLTCAGCSTAVQAQCKLLILFAVYATLCCVCSRGRYNFKLSKNQL